jgi:hypothetical protein
MMKLPYKVNGSKNTNTLYERRGIEVASEQEAKEICDRLIAEGYRAYVTKIEDDGWEEGINYPPVPKK